MRRFIDSILLALVAYSIAVPLFRSIWPDTEQAPEASIERPLSEPEDATPAVEVVLPETGDSAHSPWTDLVLPTARPLVEVSAEAPLSTSDPDRTSSVAPNLPGSLDPPGNDTSARSR